MSVAARLVGAIWLAALAVFGGFTYLQIVEERQRLLADLERRAVVLGEALKETAEPALARGNRPAIERLLVKFGRPDQGLAFFDRFAALLAATPEIAPVAAQASPEVITALNTGGAWRGLTRLSGRPAYVYSSAVQRDERTVGALLVVLDARPLAEAEWRLWRYNGIRFLVLVLVLSAIAFLIVRISVVRPLADMARWTKALRRGGPAGGLELSSPKLFGPMAREVSVLAKSFHRAQAAAEEEAALRLSGETLWTEERLKQFVKLRLGGSPLFVVSNREPLSHVWRDGRIQSERPASGLVTAMEPVMRACGGVWVAQASGDADRETVDEAGRLGLPLDDPRYTLRRVWLTKEEEAGYYAGFANEGLWPLCHLVHTRPQFRPEDWAHYTAVNEKFAAAILEEVADVDAPLILIQDYHFALLPALIKRERPDARVAIFWHIPWPNAEAFGICPWQQELLLGMLGADLVGFHTQYYCNNFLETAERAIEARVEWEQFAVTRGQRTTLVKPFPISVAPTFVTNPPNMSRADVLRELGISCEFLGVGVERLDYTKGLPERIRAIGRFLERCPEYQERLVFVQLAAPSRSSIARYQEIDAEVDAAVRDVNTRFATRKWRPVLYLKRHHDHREIWPFYRHADFCMVTSLHDGMNLVAKEFVSVREGGGALILSKFTGASSELRDALLVNPYDLDGVADAIRRAVEMPGDEQRARMGRMRQTVREHNIYRWAGLLLGELSRIPEEPAVTLAASTATVSSPAIQRRPSDEDAA
ncbi:MAG: trehalose-6-phosphate synthase [Candidatus Rokubacteria bacterium]|nr:trehalose-6-phosphate synthase [Candidatus Rokubacteria bacterium]